MSVTFIVGCARSGTTSLLRALELSGDATCRVEPLPNLNLESREMFEGRLANPERVLARDLAPRVEAGLAERPHYVEKQISLAPFLPQLVRMFDCRFVIPVRDGRDVVASLIDWHDRMYPIIYRECREEVELGPHAREVLAGQQGTDPFDYSLPRPPLGDPWRAEWPRLGRFEMVSWYWQFLNLYLLRRLDRLEPERYLLVDYTEPTPATIERVYRFLGLSGFDERQVAALLDRRINSLEDRIGEGGHFPRWREWADDRLERFYDIAFRAMHRLGYEESPVRRPPLGFGDYWRDEEQDMAWYEKIYAYRAPSHRAFERWFGEVQRSIGRLGSVVELGCGAGVGYTDFFRELPYTGIDLIARSIELCERNRKSPEHTFICCDPVAEPPAVRADLAMSHASIDNTYDIDAWLRAMARMTRKVLYVSNYRGYFDGMSDHRYRWDPAMRVFFNDLSAARSERVLREEGFETVVVFPSASHRDDIVRETVIVASRARVDPAHLRVGHELCFDFEPYRVRASAATRGELIDAVNSGCAPFSSADLDLAGPLELLDRVLTDLSNMAGRRLGTMAALSAAEPGVNLALRVDVDMDPVTAVEMAGVARRHASPLSFYLLHTAPYYGSVADGEFLRNEALADLYLELQRAGCEVGLHTDGLRLYLDHGIDGAAAVVTELGWLRSLGLRIQGTAAHNAAPVYGAENFELFKERNLHQRELLVRNNTYVPLGTLEESSLGLSYEAGNARPADGGDGRVEEYLAGLPPGDFLRDPSWLRSYLLDNPYCSWGFDYRIWLVGRDLWAVAGRDRERAPVWRFPVPWTEVARFLDARDPIETACITLHPIYLGFRRAPGAPPEGSSVLRVRQSPAGE